MLPTMSFDDLTAVLVNVDDGKKIVSGLLSVAKSDNVSYID